MGPFTGPKSWLFAVVCGFLQGAAALITLVVSMWSLFHSDGKLWSFLTLFGIAICLAITAFGHLRFLISWYMRLEATRQMPRSFKVVAKVLGRILDGLAYGL